MVENIRRGEAGEPLLHLVDRDARLLNDAMRAHVGDGFRAEIAGRAGVAARTARQRSPLSKTFAPRAQSLRQTGVIMTYLSGAFLIVLAGVLWSTQGLIIRLIPDAGSWAILFWRSAGMLPVLAIWIAVSARGSLMVRNPLGRLGRVWGGLGLVMAFSGAIYAFQATSVANAVLLFAASPFFAAILGAGAAGRMGQPADMVCHRAGRVGHSGDGRRRPGGRARWMAMSRRLASALGFAIFTVTLRWGKLANMLPAVALGGVFSMIAGAIALAMLGNARADPAARDCDFGAMGAVTLTGGMLLYTIGSRVVPAAQATLLSLVEVLLAPIWVWLLLGETVSRGTLIGGAVSAGGGAFECLWRADSKGAGGSPPSACGQVTLADQCD